MKHVFKLTILILLSPLISLSKTERVIVILDCSISMKIKWHDQQTASDGASYFVNRIADSLFKVNSDVELALIGFGNGFIEASLICYNSSTLVDFTKDNKTQIALRLNSLSPNHKASIAYAVKQTLLTKCLNDNLYNYHIIMITNGPDSCFGDYCAELNTYNKTHQPVMFSSVLFTNDNSLIKPGCSAHSYNINDIASIDYAVNEIVNNYRKLKLYLGTVDEEANNGFGFLQPKNLISFENIKLFYKVGDEYISLEKLNISSMKNGQPLKLKAGHYKIVIKANQFRQKEISKEFIIRNDLITELTDL